MACDTTGGTIIQIAATLGRLGDGIDIEAFADLAVRSNGAGAVVRDTVVAPLLSEIATQAGPPITKVLFLARLIWGRRQLRWWCQWGRCRWRQRRWCERWRRGRGNTRHCDLKLADRSGRRHR
eukprot:scaffold284130_cov36-Tisochrysis_lutea.AAC.1